MASTIVAERSTDQRPLGRPRRALAIGLRAERRADDGQFHRDAALQAGVREVQRRFQDQLLV